MTPVVMPTYARYDVAFERGEGAYLFSGDGKRYLDFGAGIAVASLGHGHPHLNAQVKAQIDKLWHTSNLYRIPGQEQLARRLVDATFADTVFFTNSGAEAMECAIKMVRKYHHHAGNPCRNRIITFKGAFHGRTIATISAAKQEKHTTGFAPLLDGFDQVEFGNLDAVRAVINDQTAAIMIEPVQGEGGIRPATPEFLKGLREICDEFGLLLVLDEVQTGIGRTGKLYAYEWSGIEPDILASAKGLGGGFPVGACLATEKAASGMTAGTHGSTYGGNPLAMAAANAVLDIVLEEGFLERVQKTAESLRMRLEQMASGHGKIFKSVRGLGLLLGLECVVTNTDVVAALFKNGLLSVPAGDNVVRIIPPLIIEKDHIDLALSILDQTAEAMEKKV